MNIYTEDAVVLTQNSAKRLLATLLSDNDSLSRRNAFISDVKQNMTILDNGRIIVDIPGINFFEHDGYEPVKTIVGTKTVSILVKEEVSLSMRYSDVHMYCYNQNDTYKKTRYGMKNKTQENTWNTSTEQFDKAS